MWERACSRSDPSGAGTFWLNQRQQRPPSRRLERAFRCHHMHPAAVITHEQQRRALAMQRPVIIPAKPIRQGCAVQLGTLAHQAGQLRIGQRLTAQLIARDVPGWRDVCRCGGFPGRWPDRTGADDRSHDESASPPGCSARRTVTAPANARGRPGPDAHRHVATPGCQNRSASLPCAPRGCFPSSNRSAVRDCPVAAAALPSARAGPLAPTIRKPLGAGSATFSRRASGRAVALCNTTVPMITAKVSGTSSRAP